MKTIAVVFATMLALGAAAPTAQAAQNTETSLKVQSNGAIHVADEISSRRGGHGGWHGHRGGYRHGWHGRGRGWHGGWHGHRRWYGHRHWGYRGYGWHRHRHCWRVWRYGRPVVVCGWRRW